MCQEISPFSIVYQITQECPFRCDICLRHYSAEDSGILTSEERRQMVDILAMKGLRRLTVTGGEPTIVGDSLFIFLNYIHQKHIHTCLTTTGFNITQQRIEEMDRYLDQMIISIRSLNRKDWEVDFGKTQYTLPLFDMVLNILYWIKSTSIILEVNTVVHRENADHVQDLGWQLAAINCDILWRIDEYYPMGLGIKRRKRFEIDPELFQQICVQITESFSSVFKGIRCTTRAQRASSPEFLIAQNGNLITSSDHIHRETGFNIPRGPLPPEFKMLRPWAEHMRGCRKWD